MKKLNIVQQANVLYNQYEKKIKLMDKTIAEWKSKADHLSLELNNSQKDCRYLFSKGNHTSILCF